MAFAALYLALRTNDPTAVDGALRCVDAFGPKATLVHGNNHLLYPVWVRAWVAVVGGLGAPATAPWDIIRAVQAMNALFAGVTVGLLHSILSKIADRRVALSCTLVFGLSAAVLAHATSSAEPVMGIFFAVAALWLLVPTEGPAAPTRLSCAGVALAFALASYQAMATVAGVAALVVVWGLPPAALTASTVAAAQRRLGWTVVGVLVGVAVIYGAAYRAEGVPVREMPARFFAIGGAPNVYSGVSAARFANLPFGLVKNTYDGLPTAYLGVKSLPTLDAFPLAALAGGLLAWGVAACLVVEGWRRGGRAAGMPFMAASTLAAAALVFPLFYWDPLYDKLWMLPIAIGTLSGAMALRSGVLPPRRARVLFALLLALVAVETLSTIPAAARRHTAPTPHLSDATALDRLIDSSDSVVLDFDPTSSLWLSLFRRDQRVLLLPSATPRDAEAWLRESTARAGSRVVFVSVLDQSRSRWDAFLGSRVGIPYELLDPYRTSSRVLATFGEPADAFTVRAYGPAAPQAR